MLRCTEFMPDPKRDPEAFRVDLLAGSPDRYNAQPALRNRVGVRIGMKVVIGLVVIGLGCSGCSLSMHLASLQVDPETTATVQRGASPLDPALDEEDWRRAQAALSLAVDPQGSGQPVNWDNPSTKRKGSFAAAGNMVLIENTVCRPFTATIVHAGQPPREMRHAGQACRIGPGEWAMRNTQPVPVETTAKIRANGLLPAKELHQALPQPTTSMLEASEEQM